MSSVYHFILKLGGVYKDFVVSYGQVDTNFFAWKTPFKFQLKLFFNLNDWNAGGILYLHRSQDKKSSQQAKHWSYDGFAFDRSHF